MDTSSQLFSSSSSKPMGEASLNINAATNITTTGIDINMNSTISRRSKEMENLSFEISKYPRDLLQTFLGNRINNQSSTRSFRSDDDPTRIVAEDEDDEEGLNLGLGLSLGGKFGVDKSKDKGLLIRSSSIAGTMPLFRDDDTVAAVVAPPQKTQVSGLVRTSSLPVETEEEWRKRKEMQTLRRMEAKRRRSEKQKTLKDGGGGGGEEKGVEVGLKLRARLQREQQCLGITNKLIGSSMGNLFGSPKPPPPSGGNNLEVKGRRTTFGSLQGFLMAQAQPQPQPQPQPGSSQGSGESQGGTCSSSEFESKIHQGSSSCGEARSPPSAQSQQDRGSQESMGSLRVPRASGPEGESSSKHPESSDNKKTETGSSGIEDMPCVFTIGDGPNGRKVEGILYKYGKGEEVRIMCVCHGNFFSPSKFVKHAGGKDVDHPLRHIVVSPSASPFQ